MGAGSDRRLWEHPGDGRGRSDALPSRLAARSFCAETHLAECSFAFPQSAIHNHIRLFEPLVIKALKQYTTTTSVRLQKQVLDLLAQLVQLRVNYCLLDSDQVGHIYFSTALEKCAGSSSPVVAATPAQLPWGLQAPAAYCPRPELSVCTEVCQRFPVHAPPPLQGKLELK